MSRRRVAALACLAALVAIACDGADASPRPSGSARPGAPAVMSALGDSITTGFASCLVLVTCERNSWSTGDGVRVESHYRRLRERNRALRAYDHAAPGARATALGRPKARVLVVSIPDLYRLWEVGHTEPRAVRAWAYGICPALLADPISRAPAAVARRTRFRSGSTTTTPSSAPPAGRTGHAAGGTAGRRTGSASTSTWSTPWTGSTRTPPARTGSPM